MHGRWINLAAAVYYIAGGAYYFYHWFLIVGATGTVLGFTAIIFSPVFAIAITPLSLSVLAAGIFFWARSETNRLQSLNPGLKELVSELIYTIHNDKDYELFGVRRVRALHPGIDRFRHKFTWSGTGEIKVSAVQADLEVLLVPESYGPEQVCEIPFSRPLARHEEYEFSYRMVLKDIGQTARPFLNNRVSSATERLMLRVIIPHSLQCYRRLIFPSFTADIPVHEEVITVAHGIHEFAWEVKRPRVGYRYSIRWEKLEKIR
jgi:hypothetical protein